MYILITIIITFLISIIMIFSGEEEDVPVHLQLQGAQPGQPQFRAAAALGSLQGEAADCQQRGEKVSRLSEKFKTSPQTYSFMVKRKCCPQELFLFKMENVEGMIRSLCRFTINVTTSSNMITVWG